MNKKMLTPVLCLVAGFAVFVNSWVYAMGSQKNTIITVLDSTQRINSIKSDYYIDLPDLWQRYTTVELEVFPDGSMELERLNFYYKPYDSNKEEVFLLNIIIYEAGNWYEGLTYKKIMETGSHVYALYSNHTNPFTGTDKILFNKFMREAGDPLFVKDLITVPAGETDNERSLHITVNGSLIKGYALVDEKNSILLPVRDVCKALGYSVGWVEAEGKITISKGSFYLSVSYSSPDKFNLVNNQGVSYVSSIFFLENFKCSMVIDENNNVVLTSR